MRHLSTILRSAALAALVLALAAVTAAAAAGRSEGHVPTGQSGTAPGPADTTTGQADATPSQAGTTPGQAGTTPGQAGTTPGQAGTTPGQAGTTPGQAGTTPGQAGTTPAQGATPPGQAGTTPGQAGTAPGRAKSAAPIPVPPAVAPVVGESMAVKRAGGTVKVRLPQSTGYADLSAAGSVPSGAIVDARAGTVVLRTALDDAGHTQAAHVRGAVFEVRQSEHGKGMTDLILRGGRPQGCPARGSAAVARAAALPSAKRRPRASRLWAKDDHGRFRSRGRNSAATVRGTEWITQETCAGTVTKVLEGAVEVFDRHTKRTIRVRAGHSYLARDGR
jgi:hypothetical protein